MKHWSTIFFGFVFATLVGLYQWLDPETKTLDEAEREQLGGSYIELSNGVTHYQLIGSATGRVVVLIHGGTVPMWIWEKQADALVGAGYRVLKYDQFGRGFSDRPDVAYDRALYLRQLNELVDKLGLPDTFDLIGVSFGGATAVSFTAEFPDRVRTLTLISPLVSNFKVPTMFRIPVLGEFAARTVGIDMIVRRLVVLLNGVPDAARYEKLFVEQTAYAGFQRSLLSMIRTDALGDYGEEYRTVGRQNRKALLIWGTADGEISRDMIDKARSYIPNLQFEAVEEAGHGIILQRPEVVNGLILGFLGDTAAREMPAR
ncbi:MAG: alpha/beta hydrolase [Betaproteobacteria bacterium]|nr:MAG: alpha/beta hydrolase [Betaproteobacteria bacterium]